MHNPASATLRAEHIFAKDNYETPAHIWRHAIATHGLNRDAHASSLNAVLPAYDTRDDPGPRPGQRYWLNPAFGVHCGGIGRVLEAYVWQKGCTVVALLPALLHTDWWHDYVMHADAIYYLRNKVRFSNPFLDETKADYFYSFVIVCWEATRAAGPAPWEPLSLPPLTCEGAESDAAQVLRVRRCTACGKYRVLPRHQPEQGGVFVCSGLADPMFASCDAPCPVWLL